MENGFPEKMGYENGCACDIKADKPQYPDKKDCDKNEKHVYFNKCDDFKCLDFGDVAIDEQGKLLDVSLTLKGVCPNRRIGVAITVCEIDKCGKKESCGLKIVTVETAKVHACACDVELKDIRIILPEKKNRRDSDPCKAQHYVVEVDANYVDIQGDCPKKCDC